MWHRAAATAAAVLSSAPDGGHSSGTASPPPPRTSTTTGAASSAAPELANAAEIAEVAPGLAPGKRPRLRLREDALLVIGLQAVV